MFNTLLDHFTMDNYQSAVGGERSNVQLIPRDLYRLRRAHLMSRRAALRAQYAQQQLDELSLELERHYGLLTRDAVLDLKTGAVTLSPATTNNQAQGPADTEALSFESATGGRAKAMDGAETKEEVIRGTADHASESPS